MFNVQQGRTKILCHHTFLFMSLVVLPVCLANKHVRKAAKKTLLMLTDVWTPVKLAPFWLFFAYRPSMINNSARCRYRRQQVWAMADRLVLSANPKVGITHLTENHIALCVLFRTYCLCVYNIGLWKYYNTTVI